MNFTDLLKQAKIDTSITHTCTNCKTPGAYPVYTSLNAFYMHEEKDLEYMCFSCDECTFKCPNCPYTIKSFHAEGVHGTPECECGWKVPVVEIWSPMKEDDGKVAIHQMTQQLTDPYDDCIPTIHKRTVDPESLIISYQWVGPTSMNIDTATGRVTVTDNITGEVRVL